MIRISSDIPAPKGRPRKYPWSDLKIGDSFFVPEAATSDLSPVIAGRAKRYNEKYTSRREEGGVRVWRLG